MARRRKSTEKTSGWMQAVVFNSMLILLPVIGAQVLGAAFSGSAFSDSPGIEAIDQTRKNMDDAFASFAPRNPSDRYEFWYDVVDRELSERDVAAAHGFLLAAPQMLDRKDVKELMVAADAQSPLTPSWRISSLSGATGSLLFVSSPDPFSQSSGPS